jgi:hypothetical protein
MCKSKVKLIDYSNNLARGSILRCKGIWPYEELVDFMVIETPDEHRMIYALLVSSGYKAGIIYTKLPIESIPKEKIGYAVDVKWLIENWTKWGYFSCPLEDVYVLENLPPLDW